jgi:hypothetical protein
VACVFGPGIETFGQGPDSGREATFTGLQHYPTKDSSWIGKASFGGKAVVLDLGDKATRHNVERQLIAELCASDVKCCPVPDT